MQGEIFLMPVLNKSHSIHCVFMEFIDESAESSQSFAIIMLRVSRIHQQRTTNTIKLE